MSEKPKDKAFEIAARCGINIINISGGQSGKFIHTEKDGVLWFVNWHDAYNFFRGVELGLGIYEERSANNV